MTEKEKLSKVFNDAWSITKNHVLENDNYSDQEWSDMVEDIRKKSKNFSDDRKTQVLFQNICFDIQLYMKEKGK